MCGIAGIYSHKSVAAELYDSIIHLQHRGQARQRAAHELGRVGHLLSQFVIN